jgi:hypothetical protein
VGPLSSREYLKWLRLRNVTGKTAWNVVAGFRSFLGWLVEVEQLSAVPKVTWPKKPRSNPATIGRAIADPALTPWPADAFRLVLPVEVIP